MTSEPSSPEPAIFKAKLDRSLLKTYEQVLENLETKRFQLVDSRSQGRYLGKEPEPDAVGRCPGWGWGGWEWSLGSNVQWKVAE